MRVHTAGGIMTAYAISEGVTDRMKACDGLEFEYPTIASVKNDALLDPKNFRVWDGASFPVGPGDLVRLTRRELEVEARRNERVR